MPPTETKSYTPGAERAARAIYYAVEKAAAVNLPTLMAEIISRETRDGEMLEALKAIRALLIADADYSVCRKDGKAMGLGEQMVIGQIFENADNAIAKVEGQ